MRWVMLPTKARDLQTWTSFVATESRLTGRQGHIYLFRYRITIPSDCSDDLSPRRAVNAPVISTPEQH